MPRSPVFSYLAECAYFQKTPEDEFQHYQSWPEQTPTPAQTKPISYDFKPVKKHYNSVINNQKVIHTAFPHYIHSHLLDIALIYLYLYLYFILFT